MLSAYEALVALGNGTKSLSEPWRADHVGRASRLITTSECVSDLHAILESRVSDGGLSKPAVILLFRTGAVVVAEQLYKLIAERRCTGVIWCVE